jgi:GDP-L-fucose synthase
MTDRSDGINPRFDLAGKRVWVAGHRGMVGSALVRRLEGEECRVLTVDRAALDLRDQTAVYRWMMDARPDAVFLAAARVGGILANSTYPGQFLHDNLAIQTNVIEGARRAGVAKLLFLGSSCIYPRMAPQPIPESALLTGPLEPTNEWYAIAKIAGLKLAEAYRREYGADFISAMPTNLYGPGDNFDLEKSHVLPALLRKVHEAKAMGRDGIVVWGSGRPLREFMHVDDCADALVFLMTQYSAPGHVNVGTGSEVSIHQIAEIVCDVVGFHGRIELDRDKPDGTPRKLLDSTLLRSLGWSPRIELQDGVAQTYRWYRDHIADADHGPKSARG